MNASDLKNLVITACARWGAMWADGVDVGRAVNALGAALDAVDKFKDSFSLPPDSFAERLRKAESKLLQEHYVCGPDGQWRLNLAGMTSKTSSACARLYSLGYSWDHVKREWLSRQVANSGKTPIYEFCENRPNEHCPWHQSDAIEHAHMRALPNFFRTRVRYE